MVQHLNFYETLQETDMRLKGTVVMYDSQPYYVLCVTNHRDDIFRLYLAPIGLGDAGMIFNQANRPPLHSHPACSTGLGKAMDVWLEENPASGVLRRKINSPAFNKFRPFPLGMCHHEGTVFYLERHPNRKTEQGLTPSMLTSHRISLSLEKQACLPPLEFFGSNLRDCIVGQYPDIQTCLTSLSDPEVVNDAAAFSRHFALVKGPVDTLFLAYKSDIVGWLPNNDLSIVRLAREFRHTREVIGLLGVFREVE